MNGRRCIGLLLMAVFMAACTSSIKVPEPAEMPSPELLTVDSLLWQQPDSALACLVSCFDACTTTEYNRHYANLLLSELLYKNDYAQTNRRELQQAVAYYDSLVRQAPPLQRGSGGFPPLKGGKGDSKHKPISNNDHFFLAARAHYINGVGYYENDSAVPACREYLKALEIMEGWFEEKELVGDRAKFMVYTYNRLMELFSMQFMMEPAIKCGEQALAFCRKEPTSSQGLSNILYYLGRQYDKMNDLGKAKLYYELAIEGMINTDNLVYRDIVSSKALCDFLSGLGFDSSINALRQILSYATDDEERLTRYLTIGAIFTEEKMYDSALVYLKPVFENEKDVVSQIQAAECLRVIYNSLSDKAKLDECVHFLAHHKKSGGENKALVSQLDHLFQSYSQQKQNKQAKEERERAVKKTIGIIVPIAAIVALCVFVWVKFKSSKQMAKAAHTHRMEKAALSGRLKKSNEALRELKGQMKQQKKPIAKNAESQAAEFADEPICRFIMEQVNRGQFKSQMDCTLYKNYALEKNHLSALREAADRHFNRFTYRLSKDFPELTKTDLDYCCLYLLDLSDADISALMQRAYNTVNERNTKLKRVFGAHKSLFSALQDIAREYSSN